MKEEFYKKFTKERFGKVHRVFLDADPDEVWEWIERLLKEKWISVEDKLPEDKKHVLGFIKDAGHIVECSKTITTDNELWQYVTHWMPLPHPPTGERK